MCIRKGLAIAAMIDSFRRNGRQSLFDDARKKGRLFLTHLRKGQEKFGTVFLQARVKLGAFEFRDRFYFSAHNAALEVLEKAVEGLPAPNDDSKIYTNMAVELANFAESPRRVDAGEPAAKKRKRRRKTAKEPAPLTAKQLDAVYLVGEHAGNFTAAARATGKSRTAIEKLYHKGMAKLGKKAAEQLKIQALPTDRHGHSTIHDPKGPRPPRGRVTKKSQRDE